MPMPAPQLMPLLASIVSDYLGTPVTRLNMAPIGGGSINQTFQLTTGGGQKFFCKINDAQTFPDLFVKEKRGLEAIGETSVIKVPNVIYCGQQGAQQVLLLEWIEPGATNKAFWKSFGEGLAALHKISHTHFGGAEDNYMGSVPQQNKWEQNWTDFFIHHRLQPRVQQCRHKDLLTANHTKGFEKVCQRLSQIFSEDSKPCMVHGDLWSGNFMCNTQAQPVLIDPATYFGHRSVDLGMTTLFGGFDPLFYEAYHHHFPLPANYKEQWKTANLYPLLIHLLLFGKSYLPKIEQTLHDFS
jgi:protein-ribulosamine 3-kinase